MTNNPAQASRVFFIYFKNTKEKEGPLSENDLRDLFAQGKISRSTLCWHEGLPDWVPLEQCITMSTLPPPLPESVEKPEIVKKIQNLIWATMAISVIRTGIEFPRLSQEAESILPQEARYFGSVWPFFYGTLLLSFAFMAVLSHMIGKGKNWARWLYVISLAWGTPFAISPLIQSLLHEPISGILGLLQIVIQINAGVLLFTAPTARTYYSKQ